jgi:hypothetical protein
VGFAAGSTEDVLDVDSARGQAVGDQRTMASPGDRFRAHDHGPTSGGKLDELGQVFTKRGGLHIIRVAAKAGVLPAGIDGILSGVPEPSEPGQMEVPDPVPFQGSRKLILAELRIPARLRDRADIHELLNAMSLKHFEELLDGQRGVADGEDRQSFTIVRR